MALLGGIAAVHTAVLGTIGTHPFPTQEVHPVPATDNSPAPPKTPTNISSARIEQNTVFWEAYNNAGDLEDKEFVGASGSDLDTLLIFAGLFSATNTAFIIESYKNLKPDPADETNKLLLSVFSAITNPSNATLDTTTFTVSHRDIRINAFFFTSLCCSLSAAFGAVLAKQWLTQYDRDGGGSLKSPAARGRERQRKSDARGKWHLEDVIVTLPTLLQLSLFFFFIGLIDLLWPLNDIVSSIVLGFTLATFLFYVTTIVISVADESAPFQTRLSLLLQSLARRILGPGEANAEDGRNVDASCFAYLFQKMVEPEDVRVFAEAVVSLWGSLAKVAITNRFIDIYLKPATGQIYSLPRLYGPHRPSLLKILDILVTDWRSGDVKHIQTPLHSIDMVRFSGAIPMALQKAFVADPTDIDSLSCITNILFTLQPPIHPLTSLGHRDTGAMELWLHNDVTKNLQHADFVAQRNTLKLLVFVTTFSSFDEQIMAGELVHRASTRNPGLKKLANLTVLKELWSELPVLSTPSGALSALPLFSWILTEQVPEDVDELADMVESLPLGSKRVKRVAESFISRVVGTLLTATLKPMFEGWWRLPGLRGQKKRSSLRIIHTIVVRWRYLEADLELSASPYQLLHPLVSSLHAELWDVFLAAPKDSEDVRLIAEICQSLPKPESPGDDEISTTAMRKISADISALFQNDQEEPTEIDNSLAMLSSNANSRLPLAHLHAISLSPKTSLAIPNRLRSTMWDGDTAELGDFWMATFRVQTLPMFFSNELRALRYSQYLHLWLERYHHEARFNDRRRLPMCWAYLLSLQQMFSNAEAAEVAKELIEHNHQSHLLDIYDRYNYGRQDTCPLLALHLFLRLWSHDESDLRVGHVVSVVNGLRYPKLSLTKITRDLKMYARSSRASDVSEEQWAEDISGQVARDMGEMLKCLHAFLNVAIQRGLVDSEEWNLRLKDYSIWCDELDGQLKTGEYGLLAEDLRGLRWCSRDPKADL